ncbi:hypothetical protein [Devosia sp.]|uniref:hypothetical protein n=1 Tax=Devosia sp. TaxID=1871048 RepID=UPI0026378817|nr:hypothetical protein [Devosia sp.]
MARTFSRLLRRHQVLNDIHRIPINKRTIWQRLTFKARASAFTSAVGKRYAAFIPVGTRLSPTIRFGHAFNGVHIAGNARIGEHVLIMQNVPIGANMGHARDTEAPVIGNNVFIGANACIIGRCVIGDGAKIGAGVVLVNATIPAGAVIVNNSAYDLTNDRSVYSRSRS